MGLGVLTRLGALMKVKKHGKVHLCSIIFFPYQSLMVGLIFAYGTSKTCAKLDLGLQVMGLRLSVWARDQLGVLLYVECLGRVGGVGLRILTLTPNPKPSTEPRTMYHH